MASMPEQLVFEMPHRAAMGLEDFLVSDSNAAAVALIDRWPDWPTDTAPGDLKIALPDLLSRLKALPLASIEAPDDALLRAVLVKLFADRQLSVEPHIVDYVLVRMERSMSAAERFVAEADRQALVLQRRVTRAIAAAALDSLGY